MEITSKQCGVSLLNSAFSSIKILNKDEFISKIEESIRNEMSDLDTYTWNILNIALRVSEKTWTGYHSWYLKEIIEFGYVEPENMMYMIEGELWPEVYNNRYLSTHDKQAILAVSEAEFDGILVGFKELTERCCSNGNICSIQDVDKQVEDFFVDIFPNALREVCLENDISYFPEFEKEITLTQNRKNICMDRKDMYDAFSFQNDLPSNPKTKELFNRDLVVHIRDNYRRELYMRDIARERISQLK